MDPNDIPCSHLAAHSTHNRSIPFLVRANRLSVNELAANYKSCRPGLHKEHVGLSFVPLRGAICGAVHQKD
jgi:hypothetical protein